MLEAQCTSNAQVLHRESFKAKICTTVHQNTQNIITEAPPQPSLMTHLVVGVTELTWLRGFCKFSRYSDHRMWSNSRYSPIKNKRFPNPPERGGFGAVVSSLCALFQQDVQQVIKSKYSFEWVLLWNSSSQCRGFKRQVLNYSGFYKENWHYKQSHKTLVQILSRRCCRPPLWKLTSVLNSKCFSIYKDTFTNTFLAK